MILFVHLFLNILRLNFATDAFSGDNTKTGVCKKHYNLKLNKTQT